MEMNSIPEKTTHDQSASPSSALLPSKNIDDLNTGEDSPILVQTSPVSSPVFVPKDSEAPSSPSTNTGNNTIKLVLPELDETTINTAQKQSVVGVVDVVLTENASVETETKNKDEKHNKDNTEQVEVSNNKDIQDKASQVVRDFKYCYNEVISQIKNNKINITTESLIKILRIAITVVEQTKESGSKKKEFVTRIMNDIFLKEATTLIEDRLHSIELLNCDILSDAIECIVDASKGKLDLNRVEKLVVETGKSCFSECWSRLFKKK
jgi:hypothetical protein